MIPLHVRSHYSLLRGASPVEALVARARALGLPALALTDTDGIYGVTRFWAAAKAAGLTPLIGAEVNGLTLVTRSYQGWGNLCTLLSRRHLGGPLHESSNPASQVRLRRAAALEGASHESQSPGAPETLVDPDPDPVEIPDDFALFEGLHVIAPELATA